jgi:hypothetical protein
VAAPTNRSLPSTSGRRPVKKQQNFTDSPDPADHGTHKSSTGLD